MKCFFDILVFFFLAYLSVFVMLPNITDLSISEAFVLGFIFMLVIIILMVSIYISCARIIYIFKLKKENIPFFKLKKENIPFFYCHKCNYRTI